MTSDEKKSVFGFGLLTLFIVLGLFLFALSGNAAHWSEVEGSSEKAIVTKSQFGIRPYHSNSAGGRTNSVEWLSCIEVKTENGETDMFICRQEDPIAGLSVGDDCTICIKQYGLINKETSYFVNDVMVNHCTEDDLSKAFLKDFN